MSVLTTSTPVIETREKVVETAKAVETTGAGKDGKKSEGDKNLRSNLAQVLCIRYPVTFQKKSVLMSTLFDLSSKVNTIHLTVAKELGFFIKPTDIEAEKIDGITLDIFGIVVAAFSMIDKANQVRFFKKNLFSG